ncbi:MAG: AAA family ATPase [Mycobacterium sp.]|uniref:AAA family ATPase n=1 Tax=Mycobacterium sp. TaxID=1785 RepID=UPI0038999849
MNTGALGGEGQRRASLPVRGRAAELEIIDREVAAVANGRGAVVVLEGPPGIGKSRLLAEVEARAQNRGVRTLFGQAFEYQQSVPFYSLFTATLHADPPVGDAEALRRLGGSADLRYWVVHDLRAAIRAAAARQPLAILLEDIHWADNATLLALRSLATQADAPVGWVLTARSGAGGAAARETLTELHRADATFVRLSALSSAAVADVVQDAVRASVDESLLGLAAKAHGSPFLLIELLRGLDEEGRLNVRSGLASAAGDRLPRRLAVGMQQRLDGLSEEAATIVRVAATLPDRFSAALLAAVLERPPASLMSGVQESVRADLLVEDGEQLRFRHDLLREATRQSMPSSLRRAMERQSAAIMLDMGAAPAEVATQLGRSAEVGDQAAVAELRRAARDVANSDPGAAADLSVRALQLLPADDPQRGPLTAEAVELLNRADRYGEADKVADAALSAEVSPEEEAEIRLRRAAVIKETIQRRVEENRRALQLPQVSGVTRARHQTWLAYNLAMDGQHDQARAAAEQALAAGDAARDVESRVLRETTLAVLDAADGHAQSAIRRMDDLGARTRSGEITLAHELCAMHKASLLSFVGRFDEAAAVSADGTEKARRDHAGMPLHLWGMTSAIVHFAAGRLAAARASAEALLPPDMTGWSPANAVRMVILAEVAARTGDRNLFQEMVNEAHRASSADSPSVAWAAASVLARAAWDRGDFHDAARWLSGEMAPLITPLWAWLAPAHLICITRVASAAGDAGLRASVLQGVELLDRERPAPRLFTAIAQHVRGLLERDADALVAAADQLSTLQPLHCGCAAEDAGSELTRVGRRADAIDQFNAAFDSYADHEAFADARRVARTLRGLGVERRIARQPRDKTGWGSLTDAELKVVSLVADGSTNAAVAQQLQLSPHTVKTHIRNAFAKLDIHSRAQLIDVMGDSGRPSQGKILRP